MEFFENRPKRPFLLFVHSWNWLGQKWLRYRTRKALLRLSDEQLKDVGLTRHDLGC
ncbi:DUF1127 domain-containing protein [Phytobacter sp. V91]|uniref:DUF1127 domain-containing protein n=1 Tax=Phytobacter sp. V91 TaxID=3369425 RepID=UPI003F64736D